MKTTERIIIENRSNASISKALDYVKRVIDEGRISDHGSKYCYVTSWKDGIIVYVHQNKRSDRFVVSEA